MRLARVATAHGPRCALGDGAGWRLLDTDDPLGVLTDPAAATGPPVAPGAPPGPLLCPLPRPEKIFGIGLNYRAHAAETGGEIPAVPIVFAKFRNALTGPFEPIPAHLEHTSRLDYEGELAVVIGRRCRDLSVAEALGAVGAYAVADDVSARDLQFGAGGQWTRGKSLDGFCPLGPWLTSADEVTDPQALTLTTHVNGEPRQRSPTADMIFSVAELVAFLSRGLTLSAGDLILTGTPAGVALGRPDRPWLRPGDVVRVEISGLGAIENRVG